MGGGIVTTLQRSPHGALVRSRHGFFKTRSPQVGQGSLVTVWLKEADFAYVHFNVNNPEAESKYRIDVELLRTALAGINATRVIVYHVGTDPDFFPFYPPNEDYLPISYTVWPEPSEPLPDDLFSYNRVGHVSQPNGVFAGGLGSDFWTAEQAIAVQVDELGSLATITDYHAWFDFNRAGDLGGLVAQVNANGIFAGLSSGEYGGVPVSDDLAIHGGDFRVLETGLSVPFRANRYRWIAQVAAVLRN